MIPATTDLRATLGWESPNEAATFIAMLLPFVWTGLLWAGKIRFRKIRHTLQVVLPVVEGFLYLLLAQTGSRSGAVAIVGGAGFYLFLLARSGAVPRKSLWRGVGIRVLVIGIIAVFTVLGTRFAPESLMNDRSGAIRLDLWKAGLRMLHLDPWSGWGAGQSGLQYMHWFQEPDDPKRVAGTIQSFLHIGVERGIPAMWLFTTGLFCLPLLSVFGVRRIRKERDGDGNFAAPLLASTGAVGVVWIVGNFFSTQWIIGGLWVVPIASLVLSAVLLSITTTAPMKLWGTTLGTAACASLFLCLAAVHAGSRVGHSPQIALDGDWVVLRKERFGPGGEGRIDTLLLPDKEILGRDYGRELRRFFNRSDSVAAVAPRYGNFVLPNNEYDTVFGMGGSVNHGLAISAKEFHVFHPTVRPDEEVAHSLGEDTFVTVYLPDLDVSGYEDLWRRTARREGWRVVSTGWTGLDLRNQWPGVVDSVESE